MFNKIITILGHLYGDFSLRFFETLNIVADIVLLILAGVSINMVLGQNGLLNNAKLTQEKFLNAQIDEQNKIEQYEEEIAKNGGSGTIMADEVQFTPLDSNWKVTTVKEALDYLYGV